MRKDAKNKMRTLPAHEAEEEEQLRGFTAEAVRRFPVTPHLKLREKMHARSRRRAKNKLARASRRGQK